MKVEKVKISEIIITDRARQDLGDDYEQLRESIHKRGLLHPICVNRKDKELVGGFRRLSCHKDLGLMEIDVYYQDDLSILEKKLIELEENLHKELTWSEKAKQRAEIHMINVELHGEAVSRGVRAGKGWTIEDTAALCGVAISTISQDLAFMEVAPIAPELMTIGTRRQAMKALGRLEEVALLTAIAEKDVEASGGSQPYTLIHGNAEKEIPRVLDAEVIDLVIFDPPWGIDAHNIASSRGPKGHKISYADDSSTTAINLTMNLLPELYRVMKEDAHMYMFIGIQFADFYKNLLTDFAGFSIQMEALKILAPNFKEEISILQKCVAMREKRSWSFHVEEVPLIWVKDGGGFTDFEYKFMPRYETLLFCSKGLKKPLNEVASNVFEYPRPSTTERIHTQEKNVDLIQRLIKLSTQQNEIVLDPCAGSFTTALAATLCGRRSVCIDNDKECYIKGCDRLSGFFNAFKSEGEEDV